MACPHEFPDLGLTGTVLSNALVPFPPNDQQYYMCGKYDPDTSLLRPTAVPNFAHDGHGSSTWLRLVDFAQHADAVHLFDEFSSKTHCGRIYQGALDNGYFVEALQAISLRPKLVKQLFYAWQARRSVYIARLYKHGTWMRVEVDDYVPVGRPGRNDTDVNVPICCRSEYFPNVIWPSLIEKAYAKIHTLRLSPSAVSEEDMGGWEALNGGGKVEDALADLTGGVAGRFYTEDVSPDRLFIYIHDLQRDTLFVCRPHPTKCELQGVRLNPYYPYAVNRAVHWEGGLYLQLFCGGPGVYDGGLQDITVPYNLSRSEKYPERREDGFFWLNAEDFHEYFGTIFECRLVNSGDVSLTDMPPPRFETIRRAGKCFLAASGREWGGQVRDLSLIVPGENVRARSTWREVSCWTGFCHCVKTCKVAEMSVKGSFQDADKVRELAKKCDILTLEVEHVNAEVLEELHQQGVPIQPLPFVVKLIQDKYVQKVHLQKHGVPLPDFEKVETEADLHSIGEKFGYPMMLKSRYGAYDGKGNAVVPNAQGITAAFEKLGGKAGKKLYVEKWAPFKMELAVMVARGVDETMNVTMRTYPVVHTVQRDSVCFTCLTPPVGVTQKQQELAQKIATDAIKSFGDARGIFGVEMFLLEDGSVLLNEIAPRPHNTGHYTMEACGVDQFEQHLRCVLGLPLGDCQLRVGGAMMVNILGQGETPEMVTKTMAPLRRALLVPDAGIHWYGKDGCAKGRKMGHITVTGFTPASALEEIRPVLVAVDGDDAVNKLDVPTKPSPSVGIIMGSDSDLPTMKDAAQVLDDFGIPYEISIVSAHRTPEYMYEYATTAEARGINVIIAGAGGAAHLPGMVAALTPLPVIGVPVKSSTLSGNDSLLSIVQMPKGIPVATVAIGNAANAGLLAVRILGAANPGLGLGFRV
ncbi:ade6 [Symbiodinium natans]|uniref:phosphoribosylaminoimidazole carboxylase n=1 Tax=Symbiodinium natans TaxID=878477 RepID=A0A812LPW3_9DINO|nr:ade6 [Symbiodinium natans]